MNKAFLILSGAVFAGVFAALELHGLLRRRRRAKARLVRQRAWLHTVPLPGATPAPAPAPSPARQQQRLEQLARDLLDPDMYGHAVTPEVRNAARTALGRATVKPSK